MTSGSTNVADKDVGNINGVELSQKTRQSRRILGRHVWGVLKLIVRRFQP